MACNRYGLTNLLNRNNTYSICEYNGSLFCGGGFNKSELYGHNYLAYYTDITGLENIKGNQLSASIYPIPAQHHFTIDIASTTVEYPLLFEVYNLLGEKIYTASLVEPKTEIDNFEASGIFMWTLESNNQQQVKSGKLITH